MLLLKVSDCSLFSILHRGHYWFLLVEHETAKRREKQAGGRGHLSLLPEHLSIRHQTVHGRQSIPDLQSGRWQRELPGISTQMGDYGICFHLIHQSWYGKRFRFGRYPLLLKSIVYTPIEIFSPRQIKINGIQNQYFFICCFSSG